MKNEIRTKLPRQIWNNDSKIQINKKLKKAKMCDIGFWKKNITVEYSNNSKGSLGKEKEKKKRTKGR